MLSLLSDPLRTIFQYRGILLRTTAGEVRQRYAGSVAGMFWLVLSPILLLTFYSLVYLVIFRVRPASMSEYEYVLYVLSGLVPFLGFSEALNSGSSSLFLNKAILLNTVFPSELVPLRAVLASQGMTVVGLTLMLVATLALGKLSWTALFVPVLLLLQIMMVLGIVWLLSLASLVLRDIQQVLGFVTMTLLIVSPIAYTPEMVPEKLKFLIYLNPLSYFVIGFQDIIVFGRHPSGLIMGVMICLGFISFGVGFWVFQRVKRVFFDHV